MSTYRKVEQFCQKKIQGKLNLSRSPKVYTSYRVYQGHQQLWKAGKNRIGICRFSHQSHLLEPSESYDLPTFIPTPIQELQAEYYQLNAERVKGIKAADSLLIEVFIGFSENIMMAAGYDWLFSGILKNGDRFCAVLHVYVRTSFRGCGLSTLLKWKEMSWAKKNHCDFIQTYHLVNNPDFLAAIAPSLKAGFVLYHGERTGQEFYEEGGAIHPMSLT